LSLLTILQDAADRIGLVRPTSAVGASDHQVRQMLSLANQVGQALLLRHDWQWSVKETIFTATATETQTGALPSDMLRIIPKSFWNRTADRRVDGPVSAQRWQAVQSGLVVQPWDSFRIRGNSLIMSPVPTAGDVMAYEYVSKYWCMGAGETTPDQETWAADTDTSIWPDELHVLGVVWRYQKARGLEYGETFRDFEVMLAQLIGNDGGILDIQLTPGSDEATFEPYIADGNWSVT
jgi:hypothetical protein